MIAFNSTYLYLIVCYAHMKIFLLFMRNISFYYIYYYYLLKELEALRLTKISVDKLVGLNYLI